MLINDKRALAYVQRIGWVKPIEGADNIELVGIMGWTCIAKKGEFREGDLCVYFEIDSKLPETDWSEFMRAKKFKVKTMKLGKFKVVSQGLALPIAAFGWNLIQSAADPNHWYISTGIKGDNAYLDINSDVTEFLGVTYSVEEDNKRKANPEDKYKKMAQRRPDIFRRGWARWMMKRDWGRKVMFFFFGKKKDKKNGWPAWVVKTDEERCQNMPWLFPGNPNEEWIATEKIDGTSTTFTMKDRGRKQVCYVCSRNVVFDTPEKECYYDTNVYFEMFEKYNIKDVLTQIMEDYPEIDFVTIQGETYGAGVQKRTYGLEGHDFKAFNLIFECGGGTVRFNPIKMTEILSKYGVPCVDIIDEHFKIPESCEALLNIATGKSAIDGGMREGLVFRSADGSKSFKAVSNEFLMKYHG